MSIVDSLSSNAQTFRVKAQGLRRQMWWKECRVRNSMNKRYCHQQYIWLVITKSVSCHKSYQAENYQ